MSKNVKTVIKASAWGALGGTVIGLAALPFNQSARSVFMGTSVGLYMGIVVGFYYIFHRDDPGNPLRPDVPQAEAGALRYTSAALPDRQRPMAQFAVPVVRF